MREGARYKLNFVIADDHAIFRSGLKRLLESVHGYNVVGDSDTGAQTVALLEAFRPDILLLDINMPHGDGLSVLRRLGQRTGMRIIVLAAEVRPAQLEAALRLGASGVVLKGSPPEHLLSCIRTVNSGGVWIDEALAHGVTKPKDSRQQEDGATPLTPREREIVTQIAVGASNRDIATKLGISEETAKRHLSNIFDKLGLSSRLELAIYALRHAKEL